MYDVDQVRDKLIEAVQGTRVDDEWLRDIEGASAIDGEPGTFGFTIAGQDFFVTIQGA